MKWTNTEKHKTDSEGREILNRPIAKRLIPTQFDRVKTVPIFKKPVANGFTDDFQQMFKELTLILIKVFQKIKQREHIRTCSVRPVFVTGIIKPEKAT